MKRALGLITTIALPILLSIGTPALAQSMQTSSHHPAAARESKAITADISPAVVNAIAKDPDAYLRKVDRIFEQQGADGVLTRAFLADDLLVKRARVRASKIAQFLALDIDGDGDVTATEKAVLYRFGPGGALNQQFFENISKQVDVNSDGILSFSELVAYADRKMHDAIDSAADRDPYDFRKFDRDGDGDVHKEEVVAAVEEIRGQESPAMDRKTSGQSAQKVTTAPPRSKSACSAPVPGGHTETVILSGYGGAAVSTVAVAGLERKTSVATISIEEGDKPLYVLANAHEPVVWKVEGAVDRIARFVVQNGYPGRMENDAAVVGLDKKVVTFVPKDSCVPSFTSLEHGGATLATARMATHFGRPVDHVIARPALAGIHLPSGQQDPKMKIERQGMTVVTAGRTFELTATGCRLLKGSELENRFESQYPGGVIKVAPAEVVAAGPVEM